MSAHLQHDVATLKRAHAEVQGAIGTMRFDAAQKALATEKTAVSSAPSTAAQPAPATSLDTPAPAAASQQAAIDSASEAGSCLSAFELETVAFLQRAGVDCHAPAGVTASPEAQPTAPPHGSAASIGAAEEDMMALLTRAGFTARDQERTDAEPVAKWNR